MLVLIQDDGFLVLSGFLAILLVVDHVLAGGVHFDLVVKLSLLLLAHLSFNDILLGLKVEVSSSNAGNEDEQKNNCSSDDDQACGAIIAFLDEDLFALDIAFGNLLNGDILVNRLLVDVSWQIWSEDTGLSLFNGTCSRVSCSLCDDDRIITLSSNGSVRDD